MLDSDVGMGNLLCMPGVWHMCGQINMGSCVPSGMDYSALTNIIPSGNQYCGYAILV